MGAASWSAANRVEVVGDGVPVADEAPYPLSHAFVLALQNGDRLRGGVGDMDGPRGEAREDLFDDPGRQAGVEQPSDLQDPVHARLVVVAVPVRATAGADQPLLLVVAKQPAGRAGALGQLPDTHVAHLISTLTH